MLSQTLLQVAWPDAQGACEASMAQVVSAKGVIVIVWLHAPTSAVADSSKWPGPTEDDVSSIGGSNPSSLRDTNPIFALANPFQVAWPDGKGACEALMDQ